MFIERNQLAHLQAMLAGGSLPPGCVTAEAIAVLILAVVFFVVSGRMGLR